MFTKGEVYIRTNIHEVFGGQLYKGISTPKSFPFVFLFISENGGYADDIKEENPELVEFIGEGKPGQMEMTYGNRILNEHAYSGEQRVYKNVFLFKHLIDEKDKVKYIGEYEVEDHEWRSIENDGSNLLVFKLRMVEEEKEERLYFVEEIIQNEIHNIIRLIKIPKFSYYMLNGSEDRNFINDNKKMFIEVENSNYHGDEGDYVSYNEQTNAIIRAIDSKRERQEKFINLNLRKILLRNQRKYTSSDKREDDSVVDYSEYKAVSYHVYTGAANCSFIVLRKQEDVKVWCVDCGSEFSRVNKSIQNIEKCINHIICNYNIQDFNIEKLFITHPHYDHYSGALNILNESYLKNCEVWINQYYEWPNTCYNKLLNKFRRLEKDDKINIVEPISKNGNRVINILYPTKTIIKDKKQSLRYPKGSSIPPQGKPNNASSVFKVSIGTKTMIFTGDIELDGWNTMDKCDCNYFRTDYFCVSHHGSITGHYRVKACDKKKSEIPYCLEKNNKEFKAILMTRYGAYKGKMVAPEVEKSIKKKWISTDYKSSSGQRAIYFKLDWEEGSHQYIYE